MMGRQNEPERLFYRFSLERHVPADHLLRQIDAVLDLSTLRRRLAPYYAAGGRPSIDPELISKVITLDNLRVPFVLSDKMKILSFRSKDPNFQTDPGVLPTTEQALKDGIDIIKTGAQHTDLSDRGPDSVKEKIQATLDHFLKDSSASELGPANTDRPLIANQDLIAPNP